MRDRMVREMGLRRFASGTQELYLRAVEGLARHWGRSPEELGEEEVKGYLYHLMTERRLGWGTVNVITSGIRFLYTQTLGREDVSRSIPPRRTPRRLPEILSASELERLFGATDNPKHRALLMTAYAAGLRAGEVARLKLADIDSSRMMIRVRRGKGDKDRYTILSRRLLQELRSYWKACRPAEWLFPGESADRPIRTNTAGKIYRRTKERAGIAKRGGIHTLRHCFATHLLEAGADLATIQILMGHRSMSTTMGYLRLTRKTLDGTPSLLDLLEIPEPGPTA